MNTTKKFQLGIDRIQTEPEWIEKLSGKRVALMAHPASTNSDLVHSIDVLKALPLQLTAAFGPQHGMLGDLQDNMQESEDYIDPKYGIPVFSLYGEVRRPTPKMLETFDTLLVDLQDVGTRIYTYLTTMIYLMEDLAAHGKEIWILDRPNPAGRPVEGFTLTKEWESFVGAVAVPIRHGLTLGEVALWHQANTKKDFPLTVVEMKGYNIDQEPWPSELSWINPSPNIPRLSSVRCFPGTVLLEGTELSEGRGTTIPLEIMGAPDIDVEKVLGWMNENCSQWIQGCQLRICHFQPTFQKHALKTCQGVQIHCDTQIFDQEKMKPFRLVAGFLKGIRMTHPDYPIWRDFHYEYEKDRLAIDLINGGAQLRDWVDTTDSSLTSFENLLQEDEKKWMKESQPFHLY